MQFGLVILSAQIDGLAMSHCEAKPWPLQGSADGQLECAEALTGATITAEQRHGICRDQIVYMPNALRHRLAIQIAGAEDARLETVDLLGGRSNVVRIDSAVLRVQSTNTAVLYRELV